MSGIEVASAINTPPYRKFTPIDYPLELMKPPKPVLTNFEKLEKIGEGTFGYH